MARSKRRKSRRRSRSCGRGKIRRKAYRTRSGRRVRSTCIKDMGAHGHGKKILPKPKDSGFFTKMGYSIHLPAVDRRRILQEIVDKKGEVKTIRHLSLVRNYNTKGTPNYKRFTTDVEFLKTL